MAPSLTTAMLAAGTPVRRSVWLAASSIACDCCGDNAAARAVPHISNTASHEYLKQVLLRARSVTAGKVARMGSPHNAPGIPQQACR
jgi:hypothetical protein